MKTLQQHISEKLIINKNYKDEQYFIYKLDNKEQIRIFENGWVQFNDYKNKVYINGERIKLDDSGHTAETYDPGEYYIEIKDIDEVEKCNNMFWNCWQLVSVPLFNTSKILSMENMFRNCPKLISVPLLDTSTVINMNGMFFLCDNLSDETKRQWSKVYDFNRNGKIK